MRRLFALPLFLVALSARADAPDFSFEGYAFGVLGQEASSALNPGNGVLEIPRWGLGVDLRPQGEWKPTDRWRLIARPRLRARANGVTAKDETKFQIDDLNTSYRPTYKLALVAGVENFQWGPAELLSPSNPLFHFHLEQRSLLFRQRGIPLIRVAYDLTPDLVMMGMVEPLDYRVRPFVAGERFTPRAIGRVEKRFSNAGNYVGLSGGVMEEYTGFVGAYGNVYMTEAVSLYADSRLSAQNPGLVPVTAVDTKVSFVSDTSRRVRILGTVGVRYEGDVDARLEYVHNGFGYSEDQWGLALSGAFQRPENVSRLLQPGLELPKRDYLYFSVRSDRLGRGDSLRLTGRYVLSLQDGSGAIMAPLVEWSFADNCTAIFQPSYFHGGPTQELSQGNRYEVLAAVRLAL